MLKRYIYIAKLYITTRYICRTFYFPSKSSKQRTCYQNFGDRQHVCDKDLRYLFCLWKIKYKASSKLHENLLQKYFSQIVTGV